MAALSPFGRKRGQVCSASPMKIDVGQGAEIVFLHRDPRPTDDSEAAAGFQLGPKSPSSGSAARSCRDANDVSLLAQIEVDRLDILIDRG